MKISNSKPLQLFRIAGCYNISPLGTFVLEWGYSYKAKGVTSIQTPNKQSRKQQQQHAHYNLKSTKKEISTLVCISSGFK